MEQLRTKIDKCNKKIINAIAERFSITRKIGKFKAKHSLPSTDKSREKIVLDNVKQIAKSKNLNEEMIEKIFKIIMKEVVKEHKQEKVNVN